MRELMMSLTHYFFCFLLFELYNISIFTDLTIRTLLVEPQNVKTMVIPHVQEGIKLCLSWQRGENWYIIISYNNFIGCAYNFLFGWTCPLKVKSIPKKKLIWINREKSNKNNTENSIKIRSKIRKLWHLKVDDITYSLFLLYFIIWNMKYFNFLLIVMWNKVSFLPEHVEFHCFNILWFKQEGPNCQIRKNWNIV